MRKIETGSERTQPDVQDCIRVWTMEIECQRSKPEGEDSTIMMKVEIPLEKERETP